MKKMALVISCEHAENKVPAAYLPLFSQHKAILKTHRALDFGAKHIAGQLAKVFECDYVKATVTRLLIDCNRSVNHPACFSEFTRSLPPAKKEDLIRRFYNPFRQQVEGLVAHHIAQGFQVLHLSIHSFTPVLHGAIRNAAIGLLYDPKRSGEQEVVRLWHGIFASHFPLYRVRKNYPYRGNTDGFTHFLRKKHPQADYVGLEVEINQTLTQKKASLDTVVATLSGSLSELLQLL